MVVLPPLAWFIVPDTLPRWAVMWLLALLLYAGFKWLTWRRTPAVGVPAWRHLAYLLAWPGLDAPAFLYGAADAADRPTAGEWLFAGSKMLAGLACFFLSPHVVPSDRDLLLGWVGMIGIVFTLHFGLFHLLSCWWRTQGVAAAPLMVWPIASTSLSEFWGRRWNTAFRDLAYRFLFRPLTRVVGPRRGLFAGFLFSGLVHDAVITLPAAGGYGGPTLYFLIQPLGMLLQRSRLGRTRGLDRGAIGWLGTVVVLVAPAGLLFPAPFVRSIVLPFMAAVGTL